MQKGYRAQCLNTTFRLVLPVRIPSLLELVTGKSNAGITGALTSAVLFWTLF